MYHYPVFTTNYICITMQCLPHITFVDMCNEDVFTTRYIVNMLYSVCLPCWHVVLCVCHTLHCWHVVSRCLPCWPIVLCVAFRTWTWTRRWTTCWAGTTRGRGRTRTARTPTCRTTSSPCWTAACTRSTPASSSTPTPCTTRTCSDTPRSAAGPRGPAPG